MMDSSILMFSLSVDVSDIFHQNLGTNFFKSRPQLKGIFFQEISNGRTHVSRYLITRSQLNGNAVRWDSVPFNF